MDSNVDAAQTKRSVKADALNTAIAGKAIERGLESHIADGQVFVYLGDVSDSTDHLHRQVIRNLVYRLVPDSVCHIYSTDVGFRVVVDLPEPKVVEDKPLPNAEWVKDLSAEERLDLIRQLVA